MPPLSWPSPFLALAGCSSDDASEGDGASSAPEAASDTASEMAAPTSATAAPSATESAGSAGRRRGSRWTRQGNHVQADQFFDDSASTEVPDNTPSLNRAIQARAALRRGNALKAFQILHSFVEELLDNDTMSGTGLTAIEFINMMVEVDRLPDAARILGYVESTGLLDVEAAAFRTLVAGAASRIATDGAKSLAREQAIGRGLDDRQALAYIRDVLDRLLDNGQRVGPDI